MSSGDDRQPRGRSGTIPNAKLLGDSSMVSVRAGASVRPLSEVEQEVLERSDRKASPRERSRLVDIDSPAPVADARGAVLAPAAGDVPREVSLGGATAPPAPDTVVARKGSADVTPPSDEATPPRAYAAPPVPDAARPPTTAGPTPVVDEPAGQPPVSAFTPVATRTRAKPLPADATVVEAIPKRPSTRAQPLPPEAPPNTPAPSVRPVTGLRPLTPGAPTPNAPPAPAMTPASGQMPGAPSTIAPAMRPASPPPAAPPPALEPPPPTPPPLPNAALDSYDDLVVDRALGAPSGPSAPAPDERPDPASLPPGTLSDLDIACHSGEELRPGDTVGNGRFSIVGHLGAGGMADVYLAEQTGVAGFKKTVVIKRILPGLVRDQKFVDLFVREAHVASSLSHSHVVQIYELGEDRGTYFIAMEYVRGLTLMDLAERAWKLREPLPIEIVLLAVADAAEGLAYGWRAIGPDGQPMRLVHRDVSPDNLILNTDGTCKVLDFGVAKTSRSADLTQVGELKGKLSYIPPEMLEGKDFTHRGDLYGLGVSLFSLLTGDVPFDIRGPMDLLEKAARKAPAPSTLNPAVPPVIDELVLRLIDKRPERRPKDGDELAAILHEILGASVRRPTSGAYVERMLGKAMEVDDIDDIPAGIIHARPSTPILEDDGKAGRLGNRLKKLFGR